jgi:hypothetical protein
MKSRQVIINDLPYKALKASRGEMIAVARQRARLWLSFQAFFQKGMTRPHCAMTGGNFRNIAEPPKLFYDLLPKTWEALAALREQRKLAAILAADVVGYSRQTARR